MIGRICATSFQNCQQVCPNNPYHVARRQIEPEIETFMNRPVGILRYLERFRIKRTETVLNQCKQSDPRLTWGVSELASGV